MINQIIFIIAKQYINPSYDHNVKLRRLVQVIVKFTELD